VPPGKPAAPPPPEPPPPITVTIIVELVAPPGTLQIVFVGVVYSTAPPVALHPSPDLSFQVVIGAPLVAGIPVALGSAASNHRVQPGTKKVVEFIVFPIPDRSAHDVTPAAVDEIVVVA
jgi:hypothetical protein